MASSGRLRTTPEATDCRRPPTRSTIPQPVVRLRDQKPMHHEVLVRLRDDEGGYILPSQFIELAESLSLVQEYPKAPLPSSPSEPVKHPVVNGARKLASSRIEGRFTWPSTKDRVDQPFRNGRSMAIAPRL